jgi:hypothetical protein
MELPPSQRDPDTARRLATERWARFVADPDSRFAELGLDPVGVRDFKRRAWTGVVGYFAIEDPGRVDVVATEQQVQAELAGAPMYGIVDRLERAGDRLVVSDYKTGKAPKWPEEIEEKLEQLHLYAAMLDVLGTPVSTLRLLFVSPQLGAAAKAARCREIVAAAFARLAEAVPEVGRAQFDRAVDAVDAAQREARDGAGDGDDRVALAHAAATRAAWSAAVDLAGECAAYDVAPLLVAACAARRRARFADLDAERSRPTQIEVEVRSEQLEAARAAVARIWAEASACYEAWDFPATTGALCDWCPFKDRCEGFAAWDGAGRPSS